MSLLYIECRKFYYQQLQVTASLSKNLVFSGIEDHGKSDWPKQRKRWVLCRKHSCVRRSKGYPTEICHVCSKSSEIIRRRIFQLNFLFLSCGMFGREESYFWHILDILSRATIYLNSSYLLLHLNSFFEELPSFQTQTKGSHIS